MTAIAPRVIGRIALRPERESDREFLVRLYSSARADEMALTNWPAPQRRAFLESQFDLQRTHYRTHYAGAAFDVVTLDDEPIGRMSVSRRPDEIRLIEIIIEPRFRRRGIGRQLLQTLIDEADLTNVAVTLHVEPWNSAVALYRGIGFVATEPRGAYLFMERRPAAAPTA